MRSFNRLLFFLISFSVGFALAEPDPVIDSITAEHQTAEVRPQEESPIVSRDKLVFDLEYDIFDKELSSWTQGSIAYGHRFDFGSVIARYNRAHRFGSDGDQIEVDAYPKLYPGTYLYLNYGVSSSSIFPKTRYGAEIFQSLPRSFEFSIGMRKLIFSESEVTLWTGSLAHYIGNYYLYFRTYHVPDQIGPSNSWTLGARYYLGDEEYVEAAFGTGLSTETIYSTEIEKMTSEKAKLNAYWALASDFYIHPGFSYFRQEVRPREFRIMRAFDVTLEKRF